jgi:hypothetical protein
LESYINVYPIFTLVHLCSLFEFDDFNIELMKKWEPFGSHFLVLKRVIKLVEGHSF